MKYSVFIDGGAGRVITAIPALVKFVTKHNNDEVKIFVNTWDQIFWNHPILQKHVFPANIKGNWDYIIHSTKLFPEPYHNNKYINGQIHMIEAFIEELQVTDIDMSNQPDLHVWSQEQLKMKKIIQQIKNVNNKPLVIIQPYGSSAQNIDGQIVDYTNRSLNFNTYLQIVRDLSIDHNVIYMGNDEMINTLDVYSIKTSDFKPDLRFWIALIQQADYFIGVDSLGQHIASVFDVPSTVLLGSTIQKNISYDKFNIIRKQDRTPIYSPIRIPCGDNELIDRLNDQILDFSPLEIQNIIENIRMHMGAL